MIDFRKAKGSVAFTFDPASDRAIQTPVPDLETGEWYMAQGDKNPGGVEDAVFTRMEPEDENGFCKRISTMRCVRADHPSTFAILRRNGVLGIVLNWGTRLSWIPYAPGTFTKGDSEPIFDNVSSGKSYAYIDHVNQTVSIRRGTSHRLYNLVDDEAVGQIGVTITGVDDTGPGQGYWTMKDGNSYQLFALFGYGHAHQKQILNSYSFTTGNRQYRANARYLSSRYHRQEPEGGFVLDGVPYIGMSSEKSGGKKTPIAVRLDLPGGPVEGDLKPKFNYLPNFVMQDRRNTIQGMACEATTNDVYMSQLRDDDDLNIYRFGPNGGPSISSMRFVNGGHGDIMMAVKESGTVYIIFKYKGLSASHDTSGTWVKVPYIVDKVWSSSTEVLTYAMSTPPPQSTVDRRNWCQGEAYDINTDTYYRSYGVSYGPKNIPTAAAGSQNIHTFIEVIKDGKIIQKIDAYDLGRTSKGQPIGDRLEPQGLTIKYEVGETKLLIGTTVNRKGSYIQQVAEYSLTPDDDDSGGVPPTPGTWSEDMLSRTGVTVESGATYDSTDLSDHDIFFKGTFSVFGISYTATLDCC